MMAKSTTQPSMFQKHILHFDVDNYLNPICPRSRLYMLPTFVSHWLGYRKPDSKPQHKLPNLGIWISAFVGGFIGIAIITNVFSHLPQLGGHQAPVVIASFGAAAILEYNTIDSPLSQPRNLIVGHFLSALIGVAVSKGFERLPHERFEELRWLAGSISVGLASFIMGATKTVHPPAGATALLVSTSADITILGWWLLPLVLLASTLMFVSALIVNNVTRRWPLYWWTPADFSSRNPVIEPVKDVEKDTTTESGRSASDDGSLAKGESRHIENGIAVSEPDAVANNHLSNAISHMYGDGEHQILLTSDKIVLPNWWQATDWETEVLLILREKLQQRRPNQAKVQK